MGAILPLKGNCIYVGRALPPVISKLYVLLGVILLQVTEEIYIIFHMEWSIIV